jgi:nicotinamide-nucleotide amidase
VSSPASGALATRRIRRRRSDSPSLVAAGPNGGTPDKPVGTVWIAADIDGEVQLRHLRSWGDREEIRYRAAQATLDLVRRRLQP